MNLDLGHWPRKRLDRAAIIAISCFANCEPWGRFQNGDFKLRHYRIPAPVDFLPAMAQETETDQPIRDPVN